MALWPFRRKSRRKRSRSGSPTGDAMALPRSFTAPSGMAAAGPISSSPIRRRPSSRNQRREPNKLQRRMRTYSFESGRADDLDIGGAGAWPSTGRSTTKRSATLPTHANTAAPNSDDWRDAAHLGRIPSLYHSSSKRDGRHLLSRTKSSKRRKNAHDREREAEIKAMSNPNAPNALYTSTDFTPVRPAAEHWTAGRPMKRETMKAHPNSFASRYARGEKGKQPSDVSLPLAESIDSAMSSDSDQVAFVISPFAAFTPKPTLRYTSQRRVGPPGGDSTFPARHASLRLRLAKPIPEATLKAHKRIDDLANDMDASDLREMMERDARRRDRRRVRDEEKAARRLARQAERQTELEQHQASASTRPEPSVSRTSPDMARGVLGRESIGLGIGTTSAIMTSAVRRESSSQSRASPQRNSIEFEERPMRDIDDPLHAPLGNYSTSSAANSAEYVQLPGANNGAASRSSRRASPVDMYHRPDSISLAAAEYEVPRAPSQAEEARIPKESAPRPVRTPSMLRRLARLRRRFSNTPSLREDYDSAGNTNAAVSRKPSNSGSSRMRGSLSWGAFGALFRWKSRSKQPPVAQGRPSFSNLSRDSMAAQSSIQRSQNQFDVAQQGQLRNPSQTLIEEPQLVAAAEAAAVTGASASSVSVSSSLRPAKPPSKSHPLKATGVVPKRTLSRFREDLPDFLKSPPASRVQSPESHPPLPAEPLIVAPVVHHDAYPSPSAQDLNYIDDADAADDDESIIMTPTGFHATQQQHSSYDSTSMGNSMTNGTRDDTPTSWLQMEETEPSPEPQQSLSLASIDSEGSWLSGRTASRRRVTQMQPSLDSVSRSFHQQKPAHYRRHGDDQSWPSNDLERTGAAQAEEDESSIVMEDEYLSRLARSSTGDGGSRTGTKRESIVGDMLPSSDDELDTVNGGGGDARWGTVSEKRVEAVVVPSRRANLVKSHEGLMKTFYDGEAGSDQADSPISPTSALSQASSEFKEEEAGVQRATSVNLGRGGHVRRISAGSAKLLEIARPPRDSVDARPREPLF